MDLIQEDEGDMSSKSKILPMISNTNKGQTPKYLVSPMDASINPNISFDPSMLITPNGQYMPDVAYNGFAPGMMFSGGTPIYQN